MLSAELLKTHHQLVLTNTMNKQLRFCWEVEVDHDVQHWNINATCCQVGHDEHTCHLVTKLCNGDLACSRIEGTV